MDTEIKPQDQLLIQFMNKITRIVERLDILGRS